MADNNIFQYIKPNDNDMLSELKGKDLQDLIILIDDYYLFLRDSLGFDNYITFGLEIEFENAMRRRIQRKLEENLLEEEWILKSDNSLNNGGEVVSPILTDTKENWQNLEIVCDIISKYAKVGPNTGSHIHVGTQTLGCKELSLLNFIKLWSNYENIIFRFCYGNYLIARPNIMKYASPVAKTFFNDAAILAITEPNFRGIINKVNHNRYQAVNFSNVSTLYDDECEIYNTIEFRCPNGTLDPVIWQNNVNLFVKLLLYSKSSKFNNDIIDERQQINGVKYSGLNYYNEIFLGQALELIDMIFDNNFDKIYFLRQYLKSYSVTDNLKYISSNDFTRKIKKQ